MLSILFKFEIQINSIAFDDHFVEPDTECILTGWGYTLPIRDPGILPNWVHAMLKSYPKDLQVTELRTISNEECRDTYSSMTLDTELCTFKWGTGACSVSVIFYFDILLSQLSCIAQCIVYNKLNIFSNVGCTFFTKQFILLIVYYFSGYYIHET